MAERTARLLPAAALFALFAVLGLVVLLIGPGRAAGTPLPQASPDAAAGRRLYEERCATCHAERGQGTDLGPPIAGLGPAVYDFMLSTGRMPVDRPVVQAARKRPAFDRTRIDQLIAYLTSLPPGGGTPIPSVDPGAGDLSAGQAVYQQNCAPCHGATGIGGAVGAVDAPALDRATATQIGEAMRIGPGAMPVFDARSITDAELDSVARYVLYLRRPEDAGGLGLGHVGPIVEGLVALLVGLGAIVVVSRLIGERT